MEDKEQVKRLLKNQTCENCFFCNLIPRDVEPCTKKQQKEKNSREAYSPKLEGINSKDK